MGHGVVLALLVLVGRVGLVRWLAAHGVSPNELFQASRLTLLALPFSMAYDIALVLGVGLLLLGGLRPRELGWTSRRPLRHVAFGLGGWLLMTGLMIALGAAFQRFTPADLWQAVTAWTARQRVLFACVGVDAVLVEESIFRGYLQPSLVKRLGSVGGVLTTAVIFAVYHLQFQPMALLDKLMQGLVLGALAQRSRSLFPSAVAHAANWWLIGAF